MVDDACRVQAIYRPRTHDIRIIRRDGASFDIPAVDAIDLAQAIGQAMAIPPFAEEMTRETAWSAR